MDERDSNPESDSLLLPFLLAKDKAEAQARLSELIALVTPGVITATKRCRSHEDACQNVLTHLTEKLWSLKNDPYGEPIKDFPHYAIRTAANARRKEQRIEHWQWNGLKDQLRHVLTNDRRFALWNGEDQKQLGGREEWRGQPLPTNCDERLLRLLADPLECEDALLGGRDAQRLKPAELLEAIFAWVQHPIEFNDLVNLIFALRRLEKSSGDRVKEPVDLNTPEAEARLRELLKHLWVAVETLEEPNRRAAYLLNFSLEEYGIEVFPFYGIASIRRIGAALQLSDEQFESAWAELEKQARYCAQQLRSYDEKFALLWQYLPLKDKVIAKMLGTRPMAVTGLRWVTRIYLRHHLAARGFHR